MSWKIQCQCQCCNAVVEVRLNSRDVNTLAVVSNGRHSADGDTSDDFTAQSGQ